MTSPPNAMRDSGDAPDRKKARLFAPEGPDRLESLSMEVLEKILLNLDPKSLVAVMDSSEAIRERLEHPKTSFPWRRWAYIWGVRRGSTLFPDDVALPPVGRTVGRTVADRIVAVEDNLRLGRYNAWRFDHGDQPRLVEKDGRKLTSGGQPPCYGDEDDLGSPTWMEWNGRYASAFDERRFSFWNTGSRVKERLEIAVGLDENADDCALAIWRDYVVHAPGSTVPPEKEQLLLKIYDLRRDAVAGRSVVVQAAGDRRREHLVPMLDVLETPDGKAKAVVVHQIKREGSAGIVYIVSIPDGILERKIHMPPNIQIGRNYRECRPYFSPSVVYRCHGLCHVGCLVIAAQSATSTSARLMELHERCMGIGVAADGTLATVYENEEDEDEDSTFWDDTISLSSSTEEDWDVSTSQSSSSEEELDPANVILVLQANLPIEDEEFVRTAVLKLFPHRMQASAGDLHLQLEQAGPPQATLTLLDPMPVGFTAFWDVDFSSPDKIILAMLKYEPKEENFIYAARYSLDPSPRLDFLYKIRSPVEAFCLGPSVGGKFLVLKLDQAPSIRLAIHNIRDGAVQVEKVINLVEEEQDMYWGCRMTDTDVLLSPLDDNWIGVFYLFNYL